MKIFSAYINGFIFSIMLTGAAYVLVVYHLLSTNALIFAVILLALVQFVIQLIFFLHLGSKSSRWNLAVLLSTISVVFILVVGSIWIMINLNYHHMLPKSDQQILKDEAIGK